MSTSISTTNPSDKPIQLFKKVFIYDLSRLICVHYIKVDGGSRSISKDAPKFLNQITSPHRKTNRTQRPFFKVKQYILKEKKKLNDLKFP